MILKYNDDGLIEFISEKGNTDNVKKYFDFLNGNLKGLSNINIKKCETDIKWEILRIIDPKWANMVQWFLPQQINLLKYIIPDIQFQYTTFIENEITNSINFAKGQRDHIIHPIRVGFIGHQILNKIKIKNDYFYNYTINIIKNEKNEVYKRSLELGLPINIFNKDFVFSCWWLASLTHDMGYLYQNLSSLAGKSERFYNFIDSSSGLLNLKRIEELINNSILKEIFNGYKSSDKYPPCPDDIRVSVFANIGRNHSISSALWLLMQKEKLSLLFPYRDRTIDLIFELASEIVLWHDIVNKNQIFYHNGLRFPESLSKLYLTEKPLQALLILCDTLQEWGRPRTPNIFVNRNYSSQEGFKMNIKNNLITISFNKKYTYLNNDISKGLLKLKESQPHFIFNHLPIEIKFN